MKKGFSWLILVISLVVVMGLAGILVYVLVFQSNTKELPGQITLREAVADEYGILVSWEADDLADEYAVYRRTEDTQWELLEETDNTVYRDASIACGVQYFYTVRGMNAAGKSEAYDKIGVRAILDRVPGEVVLKSATATDEGILVEWETTAIADKYYLYRKQEGGRWEKLTTLRETSYTDWDVSSGQTYIYTVRAVNANGRSESYDKNGVRAAAK